MPGQPKGRPVSGEDPRPVVLHGDHLPALQRRFVQGLRQNERQPTRRGGAGQPKLVFAPVCDYTTGYLATYGALLALARRAREGGSWQVNVSLCQSAMLLQRQGLLADFASAPEGLAEEELTPLQVRERGFYGDLLTLGPVLRMSETPTRWDRPTPELGSDDAAWLPRMA